MKFEGVEKRSRRMRDEKCLRRIEVHKLHPRHGHDAELGECVDRNGESDQKKGKRRPARLSEHAGKSIRSGILENW